MSEASENEKSAMEEKIKYLQQQLEAAKVELAQEKETSSKAKQERAVVCTAYDSLRQDLQALSLKYGPHSVLLANSQESTKFLPEDGSQAVNNKPIQSVKGTIVIPEERRKAIELKILAAKVASIFKDKAMAEIKERIEKLEERSDTSENLAQETAMSDLMNRIYEIELSSKICVSIFKEWKDPLAYAKSVNHVLCDGVVSGNMRQVNPCRLSGLSLADVQVGRTGFTGASFAQDLVRIGRVCVFDASKQAGTVIIELPRAKISFVVVLSPVPESHYYSIPPFNAGNDERPLESFTELAEIFSDNNGSNALDPFVHFTWMRLEALDHKANLLGSQHGTAEKGFDSANLAIFVASVLCDTTMMQLLKKVLCFENEKTGATAWITGPNSCPVYAKFFNIAYKEDEEKFVFCSCANNSFPLYSLLSAQVNMDNTYAYTFDPDTLQVKKTENTVVDYDPSTKTGIIALTLAEHVFIDIYVSPISKEAYESVPGEYSSQVLTLRALVESLATSDDSTNEVTARFSTMYCTDDDYWSL